MCIRDRVSNHNLTDATPKTLIANLDNRTVETLRFLTAMLAEIAVDCLHKSERNDKSGGGEGRNYQDKTAYSCCFFNINYLIIFNIPLLTFRLKLQTVV